MFVSTLWSVGVQVASFLYPSLYVIFVGKSLSANVAFGLAYVVLPLVSILYMPSPALKITVILSPGRSSFCGASGSVLLGSTVTMCSHTYSHWFATSNVEPSSNVTRSVPSFFPASADVLAGFVFSVTFALSKSPCTNLLSSELVVAGATPSAQTILSPFQTLIVTGFSPPSSVTCSAADFAYCAL